MQRRDEIGLFDAADLLDLPEENLCRLAEEGKVKSRLVDGGFYFLREAIESLRRKQVEELRAQEAS